MKWIFENDPDGGFRMSGMQDETGWWWKVTVHCVKCGECCRDSGPEWKFNREKGCWWLDIKTSLCNLKMYRPFGCGCSNPYTIPEYCSVRMEKIDDPSSLL